MIHNEPKPSGFAFPLILVLVAMAAMIGGLAMTAGHTPATRVWVPPLSLCLAVALCSDPRRQSEGRVA